MKFGHFDDVKKESKNAISMDKLSWHTGILLTYLQHSRRLFLL